MVGEPPYGPQYGHAHGAEAGHQALTHSLGPHTPCLLIPHLVCSVQCAVCSVQFAVCSVQCAVCSVQG